MASTFPYVVKTTDADGRPYIFNTVARGTTQAEAIFRRIHRQWRRPLTVELAFPAPASKSKKKEG